MLEMNGIRSRIEAILWHSIFIVRSLRLHRATPRARATMLDLTP